MNWKFIYTVCFFVFALSILLLPPSVSSPVHQLVVGMTESIDYWAQTSGNSLNRTGTSLTGSDKETEKKQKKIRKQRNIEELRAKLIKTQLENLELKKILKLKNELKYIQTIRTPHIYLGRILSIRESSPWRRSLVINRGGGATGGKPPLKRGLPVVYGHLLVGRLMEVGSDTSRVQLVTDPKFTLAAFAMPPSRADQLLGDNKKYPKKVLDRRTGIVEGMGSNQIEMKEILSTVPVKPGWKIITAGGPDSPIPMGLTVGTVRTVSSEYGRILKIKVTPSINPENIRDVMILQEKQ